MKYMWYLMIKYMLHTKLRMMNNFMKSTHSRLKGSFRYTSLVRLCIKSLYCTTNTYYFKNYYIKNNSPHMMNNQYLKIDNIQLDNSINIFLMYLYLDTNNLKYMKCTMFMRNYNIQHMNQHMVSTVMLTRQRDKIQPEHFRCMSLLIR